MIKTQLVSRGQVWWVDEDYHESIGHMRNKQNNVQAKSRPWVIVSCEENNINSPVVNCLPISSIAPDHYPMHVSFKYKGKDQTVLCEQIRTINISDLRDYHYSFTSDMMQLVDDALANQLGLSLRMPSYDSIIKLVEKVAEYKAADMKKQYQSATDNAINELASRLDKIFNAECVEVEPSPSVAAKLASETKHIEANINISAAQSSKVPSTTTVTPVKAGQFRPYNPAQPNTEGVKKKRTRNSRKWEQERIDEFLKDCETMGAGDIAAKYGLKDKKAVYSYKYYFKNSSSTEDK